MSLHSPLINRIYPQNATSPLVRTSVLIAIGIAILTASAYLQIPTQPVKISLQSLAVVLIGLAYGPRLGAGTVLSYLGLGAVGAPVFQSGAGFAYMAGPTGGFLLGMLLATVVAGMFAQRGVLRSSAATLVATIVSLAVVFVPGVAWIGVLFGFDQSLALGLYPFIPGELVKIGVALLLLPLLRQVNKTYGR